MEYREIKTDPPTILNNTNEKSSSEELPNSHTHVMTRRRTASDARRRIASTLTVVSGEVGTKIDSRTLKVGNVGRGYNCLECSIKSHLFEELKAVYYDEKTKNERVNFYPNRHTFERDVAERVGIPELQSGMFSLISETRECFPFLTDIDHVDSTYQHIIAESEETYYTLKLRTPAHNQLNFLADEDVQFVIQHPFAMENKKHYFNLFEKFGTHYVKQATFGAKAEVRWSFADKDVVDKSSFIQKYKQKVVNTLQAWTDELYSDDYKRHDEKLPKTCLESRRVTDNFMQASDVEKHNNAYQVRFILEEIGHLFSDPVKASIALAMKVYLAEMRPKRSVDEIKEEEVVCIYCPELHRYIRVDDHGHLFADGARVTSSNVFKSKRKGNRVAFKSIKYKERFLSKALISSIFHFHRLQFMGPHESFEIFEDYLKVCGNLSGPSFIHANADDKELHHDGSLKRKTKLFVLGTDFRMQLNEEFKEEEPMFTADDYTEDILEVKVESLPPKTVSSQSLKPKENSSIARSVLMKQKVGKELAKSNSTSSLFIKDTILLPNVDELTRCMAVRIQSMIRESKIIGGGKFVEIFSEERHPLARSANTVNIPSVEAIYHFLNTIYKVAKLSPEPGIMAMIYIERLRDKTKMNLTPDNWRRTLLSTLMLASKVWEDQAVWNVDFIELFPSIGVKELNRMEQALLGYLEFSVSINASEYVKVYFELRENSMMCVDRDSDVKPVGEADLKKLEVRTANSEKEYEQLIRFHKSSSMSLPGENSNTPGRAILS